MTNPTIAKLTVAEWVAKAEAGEAPVLEWLDWPHGTKRDLSVLAIFHGTDVRIYWADDPEDTFHMCFGVQGGSHFVSAHFPTLRAAQLAAEGLLREATAELKDVRLRMERKAFWFDHGGQRPATEEEKSHWHGDGPLEFVEVKSHESLLREAESLRARVAELEAQVKAGIAEISRLNNLNAMRSELAQIRAAKEDNS